MALPSSLLLSDRLAGRGDLRQADWTDEAFRSLRTLRDYIGQGEGLAGYEPVLDDYARRYGMPSAVIPA